MNIAKLIIIFYITFCLSCIFSYAQGDKSAITLNPNSNIRTFNSGLKKITNTYNFFGNAEYNLLSDYGNLLINQEYTGTALKTVGSSFRDDEKFSLMYLLPVGKGFSVLALQNWELSNDTRSIGINKLERLNGLAGIKLDFLNESFFSLAGGIENNNQIGVEKSGWLIGTNGVFNTKVFEIFSLEINTNGDYLRLEDGRINAGSSINANLNGNYDMNNSMNFLVGYKLFNRDYLSTIYKIDERFPVERRLEKRLNLATAFDFEVTERVSSRININMSNVEIDRSYKEEIERTSISKVYRNLTEFQLNLIAELFYKSDDFNINGGANLFSRKEENNILEKFSILPHERNTLQNLEKQRDNITSKTRFYTSFWWTPSRRDKLSFDYSVSILQYDTPSEVNNDDRDEFSTILSVGYSRSVSSILSAGISAEMQMMHLVFLKAARSAMNNWNRIIRLAPEIRIETKQFYYSPVFEVLANYTVYDFESITPGVQSFSYRQLGYRDTFCLKFLDNYSVQARTIVKYFERGALYWDSFAESPQTGSFEQFTKLLLFTQSEFLLAGAGARAYYLSQSNLASETIPYYYRSGFAQVFAGPEILFQYTFHSGTNFTLNGWYDFHYINGQKKAEIPNIFLSAKWVL